MSKLEKIRRTILKYPKATTKEIAKRCDATTQDVYGARYQMKKENKANGYHDKFLDAVAGAAVAGMEQAREGDEEIKAINLLFPKPKQDMVNHPPHYTVGELEVIDFIEAKQLSYHLGNVVKYIVRAGHKDTDPLQDLQKARWYLERAIQKAE